LALTSIITIKSLEGGSCIVDFIEKQMALQSRHTYIRIKESYCTLFHKAFM